MTRRSEIIDLETQVEEYRKDFFGSLDERSLEIEIDVGPRRPTKRPPFRPIRGAKVSLRRPGLGRGSSSASASAPVLPAAPSTAVAHSGPPPAASEFTLVFREKRKRDDNEDGGGTEMPPAKH